MTGLGFAEALRAARADAGLTQRAAAALIPMSPGYYSNLEAGRGVPSRAVAEQLDAALSAGGALVALLPGGLDRDSFRVRSHKLIAAHLGADVDADAVRETLSGLQHPAGRCSVAAHGSGAVIVHVVEEGDWPDLTSLALWRYASYERDLAWAGEVLTEAAGVEVTAGYVLSMYWLLEQGWSAPRLDTALRLLCMPRALVGDPPAARPGAEEALLRAGLEHDDLTPLGVGDSAIGYASWSGVTYAALDPARALAEQELVDVELRVQALWMHCSWLLAEVSAGRDPKVTPGFGWRWLRGQRAALMQAGPRETVMHRVMREAILATSGLPGMLEEAIAVLREVES